MSKNVKCSKCGKEIDIPSHAYFNAENYGNVVLSVSKCCNAPYLIKQKLIFSITPYTGDKEEDDWGVKINKHE